MELALIRSLMEKSFYDDHRGYKCPDRLFSRDVRKIKKVVDNAMTKYGRDVTPDEVEALFMSSNFGLTTAQKQAFSDLFVKIKKEKPLGADIASDVLSKLFRQIIGEDIANIGFEYVNGSLSSLEPIRNIISKHNDDFLPILNVDWEDLSIDSIMAKNSLETQWGFNIPSLTRKVEGINAGHLIMVGARSNTGKTSFHASLLAGPNGFARQGAKCVVLCNEEAAHRVSMRYLSSASGYKKEDVPSNKDAVWNSWKDIRKNIKIVDSIGQDMSWVEAVCRTYTPDIVVVDIGDKFATQTGFARPDEALKANAIHAREIAKRHNCAVFYMSQLSAEAEGRIQLNQSMMEGSKTGKASEADLMLLLAKNPSEGVTEGEQEGEDGIRHIILAKNKLSGWHGRVTCEFNYETGRFGA